MALLKEEREIIRAKLPRGLQSKVAKELGCSKMAINSYLKGRSNNPIIEETLIREFCQVINKEKEFKKIFQEYAELMQK